MCEGTESFLSMVKWRLSVNVLVVPVEKTILLRKHIIMA